jgi:hypothetical protein
LVHHCSVASNENATWGWPDTDRKSFVRFLMRNTLRVIIGKYYTKKHFFFENLEKASIKLQNFG